LCLGYGGKGAISALGGTSLIKKRRMGHVKPGKKSVFGKASAGVGKGREFSSKKRGGKGNISYGGALLDSREMADPTTKK